MCCLAELACKAVLINNAQLNGFVRVLIPMACNDNTVQSDRREATYCGILKYLIHVGLKPAQ